MDTRSSSPLRIPRRPVLAAVVSVLVVLAMSAAVGTVVAAPLLTGRITGVVISSRNRMPAANVLVQAMYKESEGVWRYAGDGSVGYTDPAGRFTFDLTPRVYRVLYSDHDAGRFASRCWPLARNLFDGQDVTVTAGTTQTCDVALLPACRALLQVVTEATGGPVARQSAAAIVDVSNGRGIAAATDAQGLVDYWGLTAGPYRVRGNPTDTFDVANWSNDYGSDAFSFSSAPATFTTAVRVRHKLGGYKDVVRVAGNDRYDSAIKAAVEQWRGDSSWDPVWNSVTDLVIASGEDWALVDALSASGLAGACDAPLLLTRAAALPPHLGQMLRDMPAGVKVHIVGGTAVVSDAVEQQIADAMVGETIYRTFGNDKYATAAAVADAMRARLGALPGGGPIANRDNAASYFDSLALTPSRSGCTIRSCSWGATPSRRRPPLRLPGWGCARDT
jgi:hypothetical protein